jgi:hypothetical protein
MPVRIARVGKHRVVESDVGDGAVRGLGGGDLGWREGGGGGGGYTGVWCVCEGVPFENCFRLPFRPLQGRRSLARGRWTRTRGVQGAQYYGRA